MATGVGIPRFDPVVKSGPLHRAVSAFLRSDVARGFGITVAARVDPWLLKATRGYVSVGGMLPSVNMTSTGAKSGQPRTCTLLYFSDGDDVILVASSFGRDHHPAWYHNLKANPQARLERAGRSGSYVAAEVVDDAERDRLFALAELVYPGYAGYRVRADAIGRTIPILRLTLAEP
jgi:deazaflavin-dependent oxidoreductase (nitroreductase family)